MMYSRFFANNYISTIVSNYSTKIVINKRSIYLLNTFFNQSEIDIKSDKGNTDSSLINKKNAKNSPFLKNLFIGKYDTNLLVFPETLSKKSIANLNEFTGTIDDILSEENKDDSKNYTSQFKESALDNLINHRLFSALLPSEYGGMNLKATENLRISEVLSANGGINEIFNNNDIIVKCLLLFGSNYVKQKFLPKLNNQEITGSFCFIEDESGCDASMMTSHAEISSDGSYYSLNGIKSWCTRATNSNFFLVFAKTNSIQIKGVKSENKVSCFLVEKDSGLISISPAYSTLALKGAEAYTVQFKDCKIPNDNLIGNIGDGFQIASHLLYSNLYSSGSANASILKKLLAMLSDHVIKTKRFQQSLKDFGLTQQKIADIAIDIYVMESMSYVTAGIIDSYSEPDVTCESAAVKIFSSEALFRGVNNTMQLLGSKSLKSEFKFDELLLDSKYQLIANNTIEILNLFLSLTCLQNVALEFQNSIKKFRDPFNNVKFLINEKIVEYKTNRKNPTLVMKLYNHVHPDLGNCAEVLEIKIWQLKQVVLKYWTTYLNDLQFQQLALKRFSNIAVNLYAIHACLSRATRSKSIGLKNCDHEILLALSFTGRAIKQIENDLNELELGFQCNGDINIQRIAEAIYKNNRFVAEHPLTKNW